jgi:hypothetical protein
MSKSGICRIQSGEWRYFRKVLVRPSSRSLAGKNCTAPFRSARAPAGQQRAATPKALLTVQPEVAVAAQPAKITVGA